MNTTDLTKAVTYLLWEEAKRRREYDASRYLLDVVDDATFAKLDDPKREALRVAEFDRLERGFDERAKHIEADVRASLLADVAALRQELLPLARYRLPRLAQQVSRELRLELRRLVKEHRSSEDAVLFAYLTMQDAVDVSWAEWAPAGSSEDRFADEEFAADYDGPEQLGSMLRELTLPTKADVARARIRSWRKAYAA